MGRSAKDSETDSTGPRNLQLDHRQPPHGQERRRQPEPGLPPAYHLGRASGVGVEPAAHLGDLGLVGVAGDQARVSRGDQPGGLGPDGRVVGRRVAPLADRGVGQGAVDPEHGGDSRHRGDHRDRDDQDAEPRPATARRDGSAAASTPGAKDRRRSTSAAANGTASHHSHPATMRYSRRDPRKAAGSPLHHRTPSSSEPGLVTRRQLGQHLPHDVVAQRRVDRGPGIVERVVLIELVAVHHPDQLAVPSPVSTARSQARATSVTPRRSRSTATESASQASWPSWLPGVSTTR